MNSIHDLGGMHNFGPVAAEPNEPVFHAPWEARTFGLWLVSYGAMGFVEDESRNTIEHTPPTDYLALSYYEKVLGALERLGVEKGVFSDEELGAVRGGASVRRALAVGRNALAEVVKADQIPAIMRAGGTKFRPDAASPAAFALGQAVVAKNMHPVHHTRLPRYARGKRGTIAIDHGPYVFPDTSAHGQGENPQRVYSVRFAARELWGPEASAKDCVYLDLFESYLEPA